MITNSTTNSLIATSTRLTRSDSLMPIVARIVSTMTSSIASTLTLLSGPIESGQPSPIWSRNNCGVRRPALRHDACPEHQLEQQVPADDPGEDLAEREVRERVRRTRTPARWRRTPRSTVRPARSRRRRARTTVRYPVRRTALAARPVRVKMPAPMMTPMPKTVRSSAVRRFLSWYSGSSVSAIDCSIVFFRNRLICTPPQTRTEPSELAPLTARGQTATQRCGRYLSVRSTTSPR